MGFSSCASLPVLGAKFLGEIVGPSRCGSSLGSCCRRPPCFNALGPLVGAGVGLSSSEGPFPSCCCVGDVLDLRDAAEPVVCCDGR
ncbi:hypothetical protein L596_026281 [Steinernema carpocapsae]|uniref:Uncharacterized protein n=1 Tax=Steinernema carpocapsae TaxID=34508 RepID=A0A4U5M0W0_STECR|nr:hypothetical protein L596_026281 [Steinernema carpocapsae]